MCYGEYAASCDVAGRLYRWTAAIDSVKLYEETSVKYGFRKGYSTPDTVYGICPPGWHLPSNYEWIDLFRAVGDDIAIYNMLVKPEDGKNLMSKSGWLNKENGTDAYGFTALPLPAGKNIDGGGLVAIFWSSTNIVRGDFLIPLVYIGGEYYNDYCYGDCGDYYMAYIRCIENLK